MGISELWDEEFRRILSLVNPKNTDKLEKCNAWTNEKFNKELETIKNKTHNWTEEFNRDL